MSSIVWTILLSLFPPNKEYNRSGGLGHVCNFHRLSSPPRPMSRKNRVTTRAKHRNQRKKYKVSLKAGSTKEVGFSDVNSNDAGQATFSSAVALPRTTYPATWSIGHTSYTHQLVSHRYMNTHR